MKLCSGEIKSVGLSGNRTKLSFTGCPITHLQVTLTCDNISAMVVLP